MSWLSCCAALRPFASKLTRCSGTLSKSCTSVSVISQTPWGLLRSWHDVLVLFQNPAWQAQNDTAVSLWVSRAKYQFRLWSLSWPFCSDSPEWCSRHMVTWFGRHGDAFGMTENAFFHAFITLRSQFYLHHHSQRALTEMCQKSPLTLDLFFQGQLYFVDQVVKLILCKRFEIPNLNLD